MGIGSDMTEDIRLMLDMIEGVMRHGEDPYLTDILTTDNLREMEMARRSIYFVCDIDKPEPESDIDHMVHETLSGAEDWPLEYMKGMMMGLIMGLYGNKEDNGLIYRLLQSMAIERSIDE